MTALYTILYLIAFMAVFYFFLIRPQQKRQKEHQALINSLKVDDRVITAGGIIGTVVKVKDDTVVLRTIDNVKFEVLKTHITARREEKGD
ncbi:MAG: preprotein translocase subunit YajC [Eubacteriales bacterium]|nr:preprotein translocase subunit YajC [Eubacteriales bacterium]MDN5364186.1 preprotein translocase subunit YajC [Eubacteriales bacterium]